MISPTPTGNISESFFASEWPASRLLMPVPLLRSQRRQSAIIESESDLTPGGPEYLCVRIDCFVQYFVGNFAYLRGKSDINRYLEQVELQGERTRSEMVILGRFWYTGNALECGSFSILHSHPLLIILSKEREKPAVCLLGDSHSRI